MRSSYKCDKGKDSWGKVTWGSMFVRDTTWHRTDAVCWSTRFSGWIKPSVNPCKKACCWLSGLGSCLFQAPSVSHSWHTLNQHSDPCSADVKGHAMRYSLHLRNFRWERSMSNGALHLPSHCMSYKPGNIHNLQGFPNYLTKNFFFFSLVSKNYLGRAGHGKCKLVIPAVWGWGKSTARSEPSLSNSERPCLKEMRM